jgi:hypothetical protein
MSEIKGHKSEPKQSQLFSTGSGTTNSKDKSNRKIDVKDLGVVHSETKGDTIGS